MAVSILLASIADSIASISISGVTVKDKDQVSSSWISTPNVLYPNPEGYISNFSLDFPSILQGGAGSPVDVSYTLNYRFLGTQVGDLATMPAAYSAVVDKVITILNAIIQTDSPYSGKINMQVSSVSIGARSDPAGNMYHGADFGLRITEMQN